MKKLFLVIIGFESLLFRFTQYQRMLGILAQCESSMGKTLMVYDMNLREMENYEKIYTNIGRKHSGNLNSNPFLFKYADKLLTTVYFLIHQKYSCCYISYFMWQMEELDHWSQHKKKPTMFL